MKQHRLIRELYAACLAHDREEQARLMQMEYRKIFRHRDKHKAFGPKWTVVQG